MKVKIVIQMDAQTGQMSLEGPVMANGAFNLGLWYSMMELARDAIRDQAKEKNQRVVGISPSDLTAFAKPSHQ